MINKPIIAIMYDFDKTLCREDMQNYALIPALGMTPDQFWGATNEFATKYGVERILSYMYMIMSLAKQKGIKLTRKYLNNLGKKITYFDGVTSWFKRINDYAAKLNVDVEHYIVSSGTKELIEGCSIAKEFKAIYGCEFLFDDKTKLPIWPLNAINYTMKTQYFFRISKGLLAPGDDEKVNERVKQKRIPYRNIIYIGDGLTDVPCMVLVKENGGKSIAVYSKGDKKHVTPLFEGARVNYVCQADYRKDTELDRVVKLVINQVSITEELLRTETELAK